MRLYCLMYTYLGLLCIPAGLTLFSLYNVLIFLCLWKFSLTCSLLYRILTYGFILLFSKYPCHYWVSWAFLVAQTVRNPLALWRPWFNPWVAKIPWSRSWESIFLTGEFHGQRSLVGDSPWGHKESGTAWQLMHHLVFLHIYSLGGTALLRLPSDLGWRSGMLGLACLLLGAVVLLYHLQALI